MEEDGTLVFDVAEAVNQLGVIFVAFEIIAKILDGAVEVGRDLQGLIGVFEVEEQEERGAFVEFVDILDEGFGSLFELCAAGCGVHPKEFVDCVVGSREALDGAFDVGIADAGDLRHELEPCLVEAIVFADDTFVGVVINDHGGDTGDLGLKFASGGDELRWGVDIALEFVGKVKQGIFEAGELLEEGASIEGGSDLEEFPDFAIKAIDALEALCGGGAEPAGLGHAVREDSPVGVGLPEFFDEEAEVSAGGEILAESAGEGTKATEISEEGAELWVAAVVGIESGVELAGFIPCFANEIGEGASVDGGVINVATGGIEAGVAEVTGVIECAGGESAIGIIGASIDS